MKNDDIYQHFKGAQVKIVTMALDSETQEPVVVYEHLDDGRIWVRSKAMFLETVTVNGSKQPRFRKL